MKHEIDLNADVGESFGAWTMGDDAALLPLLSSANIACGFHAGDPAVMAHSVALCRQHGVAIGAHPSYPDLQGFGRRPMQLPPREIYHAVLYQIGALHACALAQGARLNHVKPHGALYNSAATDHAMADAIAQAVRDFDSSLRLVGPAGSELLRAGSELGLATLAEGFADRRYTAQGLLVPRSQHNALITDEAEAERQLLDMVLHRRVVSEGGQVLALDMDTVCLHGDGAHALAFARRLRAALAHHQIVVRAPGR
jgi:5-oxoprolinase (ATP-hydrolysing) subunit A